MKIDNTLMLPLPVFHVHSWGWRLVHANQPARDYRLLLNHFLARHAQDHPITVMVHGGGFSPFANRANPQATLYSSHISARQWAERNWPKRFANSSQSGIAIGYAWDATDNALLSKPNHNALFDRAKKEAEQFSQFLSDLASVSGDRPINILCHGLGARVCIQSLAQIDKTILDRVVILGGHEFNTNTLAALSEYNSQKTQFYNIKTNQASAVDKRANKELPKSGPKDQLLALGFHFKRQNWIDIEAVPRQKPYCKWSFGAHRSTDRMIADILNHAAQTHSNDINPYRYHDQDINDQNMVKSYTDKLHQLLPVRRRRAV